ncbi:MAG TPA: RNA polymerase sigma factor, partial [Ktedonobacterales bacterium]|nr:RNA polymerase sigma factor [Ktedonobacterales bacterium]
MSQLDCIATKEDEKTPGDPERLAQELGEQQARLARLCARLTGDISAAEDLAQETLLEAWRARQRLRNADGISPWLAAIARNVCLRWARQRSRELTSIVAPDDADVSAQDAEEPPLIETLADPAENDLIVELERQELASLLDRALALLPPDTRLALVEDVVYETPQAEIALRLGLSEGALRVRLTRGRLALRQALTTDLRAEAESLGLTLPAMPDATAAGWRTTRIWCPFCGHHPLECHLDRVTGEVIFRCLGMCQPSGMIIGSGGVLARETLQGLTSPKAILTRGLLGLGAHYAIGLTQGYVICPECHCHVSCSIYRPEAAESAMYGAP